MSNVLKAEQLTKIQRDPLAILTVLKVELTCGFISALGKELMIFGFHHCLQNQLPALLPKPVRNIPVLSELETSLNSKVFL